MTPTLVTGAQAREAQSIFASMQTSSCRPDALTYTSLASAYQRAGDWALALGVGLAFAALCFSVQQHGDPLPSHPLSLAVEALRISRAT